MASNVPLGTNNGQTDRNRFQPRVDPVDDELHEIFGTNFNEWPVEDEIVLPAYKSFIRNTRKRDSCWTSQDSHAKRSRKDHEIEVESIENKRTYLEAEATQILDAHALHDDSSDSEGTICGDTRSQMGDFEHVVDDPATIDLNTPEVQIEDDISKVRSTMPTAYERFSLGAKLPRHLVQINNHMLPDGPVTSGRCVELVDGSFLHIHSIAMNRHTGSVILRGLKLKRNRRLAGILPRQLNELCYILEHVASNPRSICEQSTIEVPVTDVKCRRGLTCTNFPFPMLRFEPADAMISRDKGACDKYIEDKLKLVVRWKHVTTFDSPEARTRKQAVKYPLYRTRIERLVRAECSTNCFMPLDEVRALWRDDSNTENSVPISTSPREYTYGDAFCGAGGTTSGAKMAGLKVAWGLDNAEQAGKTWVRNFPEASHFEMDAFEMISHPREYVRNQCRVDVLHMSPPCQVWSPVHTRPGQNDEMNQDALFACMAILKASKPRFVTLEQTFGILRPEFEQPFNALLQIFTSQSYSISCQILKFQNYGLAQSRKRCIIYAAGPGETLPSVPQYTQSDKASDGLRPYISAKSVIDAVPRRAPNHNIQELVAKGPGMRQAAWDASSIIPCITCNGGEYGHYTGRRGLTHRELAALQSFPHDHVFCGTHIKKQIGNAVAPLIAKKVLFEPILKQLRWADGISEGVVDLTIE